MDVVCERCQTQYEFDDTLISERGTTVRCNQCAHQFKIYRPAGAGAAGWALRRGDGTTASFDSLAVLQRWIGEGAVTRDDLLSRGGGEWKPLGSIAELEGFFAAAEGHGRTTRMGSVPLTGLGRTSMPTPMMPAGPRGAPGRSGATPTDVPTAPARAAARAQAFTTPIDLPPPASATGSGQAFAMGTQGLLDDDKFDFGGDTGVLDKWGPGTAPPRKNPGAASGAAAGGVAIGPPPVPGLAPGLALPPSPPSPAAPAPSGPRRGPGDVTERLDAMSPEKLRAMGLAVPEPKRGRGVVVGLLLGAALAGGGVAVALRSGALRSGAGAGATASAATASSSASAVAQDRTAAAVQRAERAAEALERAGFEEARDLLAALLATEPDEPRLRAARAQVLALWGEQVRRRADELERRAARAPLADAATLRAEAAVLRREAASHLERARQDVTTAEAGSVPATGPARAGFERALGEAARVLGDRAASERRSAASRAAGDDPGAALLAAALALDAPGAGPLSDELLAPLRARATAEGASVRARLLYARALAGRGAAAEARGALDAVLAAHPGHEEASALASALPARPAPTPPAASAVASAAPSAPAATAAGSAATAAPPSAGSNGASGGNGANGSSGASGSSGAGGGPALAGRSYDQLIAEGERALERSQRERARAAFMAALAARPDGSEATTGLGLVELEAGSAGVAISHFRRALSINARYSEAYLGLGDAYRRQGNAAEALRAYREYLRVNPGGSRASFAQNQITELERRVAGEGSHEAPGGARPAPTPGAVPSAEP